MRIGLSIRNLPNHQDCFAFDMNQERQVVEESLSPVTLPQAGIRQEFAVHWNMVPTPKGCNPAGFTVVSQFENRVFFVEGRVAREPFPVRDGPGFRCSHRIRHAGWPASTGPRPPPVRPVRPPPVRHSPHSGRASGPVSRSLRRRRVPQTSDRFASLGKKAAGLPPRP